MSSPSFVPSLSLDSISSSSSSSSSSSKQKKQPRPHNAVTDLFSYRKKRSIEFKTNIRRLAEDVDSNLILSAEALNLLNQLTIDTILQIGSECSRLANMRGKVAIVPKDVDAAGKLLYGQLYGKSILGYVEKKMKEYLSQAVEAQADKKIKRVMSTEISPARVKRIVLSSVNQRIAQPVACLKIAAIAEYIIKSVIETAKTARKKDNMKLANVHIAAAFDALPELNLNGKSIRKRIIYTPSDD